MYCPVCLNDTLKIASSGVVKLTFNGKAKATSQFIYNLKEDKPHQTLKRFRDVVNDYFSWYATFQNIDTIKQFTATSHDFRCSNGCGININHRISIINLVITKEDALEILEQESERFEIPFTWKGK